jgi:hypothetical protein
MQDICRFVHPCKLPWSLRPTSSKVKWDSLGIFYQLRDFNLQWSQALKL